MELIFENFYVIVFLIQAVVAKTRFNFLIHISLGTEN